MDSHLPHFMLRGPRRSFELQVTSGPDLDGWYKVRVTLDGPDLQWSSSCTLFNGFREIEGLAA
jgi:hypothetical protein